MQVVGYDAADGHLLVSDADGDVEALALDPGTDLDYRLGERRCAGTIHEGRHVACDAPDAPYCRDHRRTWVCARCTGTCLKDEMDCDEEHAVYLAAFAPDVVKVGVTRLWRLETRLREQGADRAAHVRTVADGRIAREIEAGLAADFDITDRVRVPVKRRGLHRSVDEAAWNSALDSFDPIDAFAFDYGLDLSERPIAETLATGTVRGTKGRLLVLETGGTTYAVDVRDLVGYDVEPGGTTRSLQSNLGAF
ncbi:DUF2797 domain-containing protein [Haloplanus sp. GCM10025708]|uniref:DUF2797 domain-containing protein n=1 Tax=Haloferacaceae TaxID=1644056 RepID=UPI003623A9CE